MTQAPTTQHAVSALNVLNQHCDLWDERLTHKQPFSVLKAMISVSLARAQEGDIVWDELYREFYATCAAQKCVTDWRPMEDPTKAKRKGKDGVDKAIQLLNRKIDAVRHELKAGNQAWMPRWKMIPGQGGAGREARFALTWTPLETVERPPIQDSLEVHYTLEHSESDRSMLRWLIRPLQSQRMLVRSIFPVGVLSLIALLAVLTWMAIYRVLAAPTAVFSAIMVIEVAILASVGMRIWSHLMAALSCNWASAPFLFQSNNDDVLLRFSRPADGQLRQLDQVRYKGKCPQCGAVIRVKQRRAGRPEELVGVCDDAPAFHVATFDPTTEKGRLHRAL